MSRFTCRHCGQDTGTSDSHICGRCACLPVAARGRPREPGSDDDRKPTRCVHCGLVGSGEVCPQCLALIADIDQPAPVKETEEARRARIHAARVAHIQESWERGRRCLLARALDPANQEWARCEPRGAR